MARVKKTGDAEAAIVESVYRKVMESIKGDPEKASKAAEVMGRVEAMLAEPGDHMMLSFVKAIPAVGSRYSNEFGIFVVGGPQIKVPTPRAKRMLADFPGCFVATKEPREAPKGVATSSMSGPKGK